VQSLAPDYYEPTVGWRVWLVVADGGALRLSSVLYPTVWQPGQEMIAECNLSPRLRRHHPPPVGECSCGLYAAMSLTDSISYFDGCGQNSRRSVYRVVGRVSLWGRVIEGERGWRASHAYPARIYVPERCLGGESSFSAETIAFALAEYRVPIEILDGRTKPRIVKLLMADSALAA
jgi:hypothetical protein